MVENPGIQNWASKYTGEAVGEIVMESQQCVRFIN